jgi:hypothetical protein
MCYASHMAIENVVAKETEVNRRNTAYTETTKFRFDCEIFRDNSSDTIETHYWVNASNPENYGTFVNSLNRSGDLDNQEKNITNLEFSRFNSFYSSLYFDVDSSELTSLYATFSLYSTTEQSNLTKFNSWDFSDI